MTSPTIAVPSGAVICHLHLQLQLQDALRSLTFGTGAIASGHPSALADASEKSRGRTIWRKKRGDGRAQPGVKISGAEPLPPLVGFSLRRLPPPPPSTPATTAAGEHRPN